MRQCQWRGRGGWGGIVCDLSAVACLDAAAACPGGPASRVENVPGGVDRDRHAGAPFLPAKVRGQGSILTGVGLGHANATSPAVDGAEARGCDVPGLGLGGMALETRHQVTSLCHQTSARQHAPGPMHPNLIP